MLTTAPAPWIVRGATFALWALAAGSAAYWGLKLSSAAPVVAAPVAAPRQVGPADPVAMARLLGSSPAAVAAAPPEVALASRFQLLGVAAGARSGGGAAVISIDGKPAKPYRVGSTLEEGIVLQSVRGRQAVLASREGQPVLTLEVPLQRFDAAGRGLTPGMARPAMPPAAGVPPGAPAPGTGSEGEDQAPSAAPR